MSTVQQVVVTPAFDSGYPTSQTADHYNGSFFEGNIFLHGVVHVDSSVCPCLVPERAITV
jgi:hypothetical protein